MNHTFSPLTEPVGLIWLLALLTTVLLVWRNRFRAAVGPGVVVIAFSLIGSTSLPALLLASLERPYAHPDLGALPEHDAVVMLGGVLEASSNDVFGLNLNGAADRVVTAAELMRRHKARALVLGGGSSLLARGPVEEGRLVENWLRRWNLVEAPIHRLGACANTRDEAARTAALARDVGQRAAGRNADAYARVTSAPDRNTVTASTREVAATSSAAARPAKIVARTPASAIEVRIVLPPMRCF